METIYIKRRGKLLKCRVVAEISARECRRCGAKFFPGRTDQQYHSRACASAAAAKAYRDRATIVD